MKPPERFVVFDKNYNEIMRFMDFEKDLNFDVVKHRCREWFKTHKDCEQMIIMGVYDYIDRI